MEPLGWLVMTLSVGSVLALAGFCFYRVMTLPPAEVDDLSYPLELDTQDTDRPD
jgi:hypothetical protein